MNITFQVYLHLVYNNAYFLSILFPTVFASWNFWDMCLTCLLGDNLHSYFLKTLLQSKENF